MRPSIAAGDVRGTRKRRPGAAIYKPRQPKEEDLPISSSSDSDEN